MDVVRLPNVSRRAFCLGILGLMTLAGGCDGTGTLATPEDVKAKENAERVAREKAFGPGGNGSRIVGHTGKSRAKRKG